MKRLSVFIAVLFFSGCASITVPNYIQDDHPYKKKFYGSYDDILNATTQMLMDFGWEISNSNDPNVYERVAVSNGKEDECVLLFTEIRQSSWFIGSRYNRVNIYIRSGASNTADVEIRYMTITSIFFKQFKSFKNNAMAERMFTRIHDLLIQ
ncbi:MAG: hypothetical protein K8S27_03440 [Candidatus Omnitrophica bacterium]|nr:hypothetical protein [Candidatus Omnitrophota bacterium]